MLYLSIMLYSLEYAITSSKQFCEAGKIGLWFPFGT